MLVGYLARGIALVQLFHKAEKREFTARKKAGLLTPEELEAEEKRLAHSREWQKEWRENER
ncbi:MAG: hypothetical protein K1W28_07130 [Lachnospiraceae bacterium]